MSTIDLTEAVDAAAAAMLYALHPSMTGTWGEVPPFYKHEWRERALPAITAAAPLIEAQVRADERQRFVDVHAAVREAYYQDGITIWWNQWVHADDAKRREMETAVLGAWSGVRS